jgi:hypothetical protein
MKMKIECQLNVGKEIGSDFSERRGNPQIIGFGV